MLRSTMPPRHSRVCSSMIDTILIGRPAVVTSNWKSTADTRSGASAITVGGAVEVPWRSRRRLLTGLPRAKVFGSSCDSLSTPRHGRHGKRDGTHDEHAPWRRCAASPAGGVRIGWHRRGGFVTLSGTVLPGDAAGEPLADPQHTLEVTNGRPPALRA
jgi:hypothetical protein